MKPKEVHGYNIVTLGYGTKSISWLLLPLRARVSRVWMVFPWAVERCRVALSL